MIIAADNLTSSRPSVRRAIESRDAEFISDLCRRIAEAGADWLDINPGFIAPSKRAEVWRFLIQTTEAACGLKLILDPPEADTLAVALGFCTREPVLNMATAVDEKLDPIVALAAYHGLEMIAATIDKAIPITAEERLALAAHIINKAQAGGVNPDKILIDPMIMPLALQDGEVHAAAVLEVLRALPYISSPPPKGFIALSNLTTGSAGADVRFAGPPFLASAFGAGLSAVMLDALDPALMNLVRLIKVFSGNRVFAAAEYGLPG